MNDFDKKIASRIETIFLFLSDRFDPIPQELENKVKKINDAEKLKQLMLFAAKCENLNEFEKALD